MARKEQAPPLPPDVTRQQDPAQTYAANAATNGVGAQPDPKAGIMFAKQKMASISNDLLEVAKVLAVDKPQLMPILNRMAMMGAQLDKMMAQDSQGQGQSAANGAEPPQGSMTPPEAPGAMGM